MTNSHKQAFVEAALDAGRGILRLAPTWVPRAISVPGRRLRLDSRDLYAYGAARGGISERWLASTVKADNGPLTTPDEGLSLVEHDGQRVTLQAAFELAGATLMGASSYAQHGGWLVLGKLFDNMYPIPFHMHQDDAHAAVSGQLGKPEAYYFPPQYNATLGTFPYTFFGVEPGTTREQLIACLKQWEQGDNGILSLSKAYRLELGTGWDVPPGILHAPGTLCTYEPQRASDVASIWQSLVSDQLVVDRGMLVKDVPRDKWDDYDYLIDLLDWDANVDPQFKASHFTPALPARGEAETGGLSERWVVYGSPYFSAKEITIEPNQAVTIKDAAAYGALCIQGHGHLGVHPVAAPTLIRFGQMTQDEFFVSADTATAGVTVRNDSQSEPLVILQHFNPDNREMPRSNAGG